MKKFSQEVMDFGFSSVDWEFVDQLLDDVKREEQKSDFIAAFYAWFNAIKIFRYAERKLLDERDPNPADLRIHASMLHLLIAVGINLEERFQDLEPEIRKVLKFSAADITAIVYDLQISLDERHSDVLPERIQDIQNTLLGGS
jgi:hypothetical protein